MLKTKGFPVRPSCEDAEISLVYRSAIEGSFSIGLSSCRRQYDRISTDSPKSKVLKAPKALKLGGNVTRIGLSSCGRQYDRIRPEHKVPKVPKTLKLGSNVTRKACRNRVVRLRCLMKVPSACYSKMKEQYTLWKEGARCANVTVSDIFAGNRLMFHINSIPMNGRRRQQLKPSVGFMRKVQAPSKKPEIRER